MAKSSKFRGVSWHIGRELWRAKIRRKSKDYHLGYHKDEQTAARVYDVAARRLHGSDAQLNFDGRSPVDVTEAEIVGRLISAGAIE